MAAGRRPGAGLPRLGEPAAGGSARRGLLVRRRPRPAAARAAQRAAPGRAAPRPRPVGRRAAGFWFGGSYDPWRALRINALLRADSSVTVDDMRRWQTDPGGERANPFVPPYVPPPGGP